MLEYHEPLMEVSEKYGIHGYLLHPWQHPQRHRRDFGLRGLIDHFCSALAHTKHLRLLICI